MLWTADVTEMKKRAMQLLAVIIVVSCSFSAAYSLEITLKRYGRRIGPNSVIDISRVGREYTSSWYYYPQYTNEGPLVCRTDNPHCCRDVDDPFENEESGEWYYPNGQVVSSSVRYNSFYVTRGRQELSLHRYSYYLNLPTGVYCCDIQSVNGSGNITASYMSPTNYSYINSSSTECVGLYSYSELRLCQDLSISNGWVTYDSPYIPGRVATVSCNGGYGLVGSSHLTCTSSGWSAPNPRCNYDCGPLSNPTNGRVVTSSGTTVGSVAIYSCDEGYHLVGSARRNCQYYPSYYYYRRYSNGWSNSAPYCVDEAKIQLKFSPSTNCLEWEASTAFRIEAALQDAIVQVLSQGDSPISNVLLTSNLRSGFFSCRSSQTETTYRTTIVGLADISAHTLARSIQSWVASSPSIRLQWYVVDIDEHCPVAITSDFEPECVPRVLGEIAECIDSCRARYKDNISSG